jgi:hypothetical protein
MGIQRKGSKDGIPRKMMLIAPAAIKTAVKYIFPLPMIFIICAQDERSRMSRTGWMSRSCGSWMNQNAPGRRRSRLPVKASAS